MPEMVSRVPRLRPVLRAVGSLWFAGVLLLLVLFAMACATVYESAQPAHGLERAVAAFYGAWWFEALLGLLAVNMLAAVLARYPFSRRQIGFVITHVSVVVICAGALVTRHRGVDGYLNVMEGQTVKDFWLRGREALTLAREDGPGRASIDLPAPTFGGLEPVDAPQVPVLSLDDVRVEVTRYLPDSVVDGRVKNGRVKVVHEESTFEFSLAECMDKAVPIGATGAAVRVLRYLPHAVIGPDKKMHNASDEPVNPAIEVEIIEPQRRSTRWAFARFPEFWSMHGSRRPGELEVVLTLGDSYLPVEPVREERQPAVLVRLRGGDETRDLWLAKYEPRTFTAGETTYRVSYGDKMAPLGVELTLTRAEITYYPGESESHPGRSEPRSYESHLTALDPAAGTRRSRVVSLNRPATFGGYHFFQWMMSPSEHRQVSSLSVKRDPGQPIVFVGYVGVIVGMVWLFAARRSGQGGAS